MKNAGLVLVIIIAIIIGVVFTDLFYVSRLENEFISLEKERIVTSNKLATAKIVYENLNHVRDLVFKNMDFPGQPDTVQQETHFFDFVTTCVNDLKLKLISVRPIHPVTEGRVTTYGYEIEIEGNFFNFGELCSKFENSRRLIKVETFSVDLISDEKADVSDANKGIHVKMRVSAFRVKKV